MALHKPLLIAHLVEHRREQEALDRCKDGVEGNDQQQLEAHEKVSGASDVGGCLVHRPAVTALCLGWKLTASDLRRGLISDRPLSSWGG